MKRSPQKSYTLKDLKKEAKLLGLKGYSKDNKQSLMNKIDVLKNGKMINKMNSDKFPNTYEEMLLNLPHKKDDEIITVEYGPFYYKNSVAYKGGKVLMQLNKAEQEILNETLPTDPLTKRLMKFSIEQNY